MALTISQRAAVAYDQNLIIFAGPGSGKTSTSVAKGLQVLRTPGHVLAMTTFTTAAAREMEERIARAAADDGRIQIAGRLLSGTFNAVTLHHYQRHATAPRKLVSPATRAALLSSMLREHEAGTREAAIQALDRFQARLAPEEDCHAEHAAFIRTYHQQLDAIEGIDLAGIMRVCTLEMAKGTMPLLPVTHMVGDEMQDADEVQLEFMLVHARAGIKTTLVADDDQTIYAWRNALGYPGLQRFAQAAAARTIVLGENFRSREEIVRHAGLLIAHNDPDRIAKQPRSVRGAGGQVGAVGFDALEHGYQAIAGEIAREVSQGVARGNDLGASVAVLARTNVALWGMQTALIEAEVPFRRDGPSLWETPEVNLLVGLLRLLVSQQSSDLVPVLAAGPWDHRLLAELASFLGGRCSHFLNGEIPELAGATPQDRKRLVEFTEATARWQRQLGRGMFDLVISEAVPFAERVLLSATSKESQGRVQRRAQRLLGEAERVLISLRGKLSRRLQVIRRLQKSESDPGAVRLLTMHASKGLEFDTVYLLDAWRPDDGQGPADVAGERRLFYVALTRARERFVATYSGVPSPFIYEARLPLLAPSAVFSASATIA